MDVLPTAFAAMSQYSQFVIYQLIASQTRPGKFDKIPIDPETLKKTNWKDKNHQMSFEKALSHSKRLGNAYGVGFVFTKEDPFFFLDIDNCFDETKKEWFPLVSQLLSHFPGAATEVSSSKKGIHVFGKSEVINHSCKNNQYAPILLELYTHDRFVALTGIHAAGESGKEFTKELSLFVNNYFSSVNKNSESKGTWREKWDVLIAKGIEKSWNGNHEDNELLQRALKSMSSQTAKVFSGKSSSFKDLWEKNEDILRQTYPDSSKSSGFNESSADAALAQHLAFWTGNDALRIQRLMLQSGLAREKYDREDYLPRTILSACGRQKEWLNDKPIDISLLPKAENTNTSPRPTIYNGNTFVGIEQQIEFFAGCVYVIDENKIMVPGGYMLDKERFKAVYGGHSFPMDHANQKVVKNAWEAFTESQIFRAPKCNTTGFRPDLSPGSVHQSDGEGGQTFVNIYHPVKTARMSGDATPMVNHINTLIKNERDALILMSYLAAIVQYPGYKFRWCVLLQGVEGNGKSLISRCIAFIIGRRYSHFPNPAELGSKFNDWMYGRIFIGIDDICSTDVKYDMIEALKIKIDASRQEIESKGGAKIMRDICANFIITTNHKDGLRKTQNDRRFAPFFTAQQSFEDLARDGLTSEYFVYLHDWLENQNGYAIFHDYLMTFEIPDEFNPARGCQRAPQTSSTDAAINQSLGSIEQEIQEAIDQGIIGFKGGWVSSMALGRLLEHLKRGYISHMRRHDVLRSLGYDKHPGLKDGRVNDTILPDGGKPRLYIKIGHKDWNLTKSVDIAKAYSQAQE